MWHHKSAPLLQQNCRSSPCRVSIFHIQNDVLVGGFALQTVQNHRVARENAFLGVGRAISQRGANGSRFYAPTRRQTDAVTAPPAFATNGALGNLDSELEKLAVNAGRTPQSIRPSHGLNQIADWFANRWPPHLLPRLAGQLCPIPTETLPLPTND